MIKKRETVRQEVKNKLQKQLKGMGIYLETFEIKSLEIVNYQLFKDMQSQFREEIKRTSELNKIQTEATLKKMREKFDEEYSSMREASALRIAQLRQESTIRIQQRQVEDQKKLAEISA